MAGLLRFRCNMMALKILHKHSFIMLSLDLLFALRLGGGSNLAKPCSFELQNNSVARGFLGMVLCNTLFYSVCGTLLVKCMGLKNRHYTRVTGASPQLRGREENLQN